MKLGKYDVMVHGVSVEVISTSAEHAISQVVHGATRIGCPETDGDTNGWREFHCRTVSGQTLYGFLKDLGDVQAERREKARIGDKVFHIGTGRMGRVASTREFDSFPLIRWAAHCEDDTYCTVYTPNEFLYY